MRQYRQALPTAAALAQMGYGDLDLLIEKIEARAERKARERLEAKARKAKVGIRQFSWEG